MKKLLSVLMSVMMLAAVSVSFAVPAFAQTSVHSPSGQVISQETEDKDDKSPATGVASLGIATTAALGAGVAAIALKKRDAE